MPKPDFYGPLLASLHDLLALELPPDITSDRKREFAACGSRLLARMRAEFELAPALAAERLPQWRQLAAESAIDAPPADAAPLAVLKAEADGIAHRLGEQTGNADFLAALAEADSETASWFRRTVTAARDYLDAYEQALPTASLPTQVAEADPNQLRNQLAAYLLARFPGLPPDPIRSLRIVPGGRGKETSLFQLAPNDLLPTRLVLRRDLAASVTGTTVYGEYPLLKKLESLGLPVPPPIAAEKDASALGGGFIIVGEVENARRGGELFAELNDLSELHESFAPDMVRALARLHSLEEHPSGLDLGGHGAGGSNPLDMVRSFQHLWRSIVNKPPMHVATELGFAWLLAHPLPTDRPRRLVHGDIGLHNVMTRDGRLAAILDWELTHLGDPAEDLAYVWSPLLRNLMSWEELSRVYREAGGEPAALDKHAVAWYSVWAHTRNSIYVGLHYDWSVSGQRKDIECFSAGWDFFARTQHYIARELDEALSTGKA